MAKDTVEKKDETVVLEKRVTRLEAVLRILSKEVKNHFGIDVAVAILFAMFASSALAADVTIVDWGTGVSGTIGTAKVTSDGSVATFTVDKIVSTGGANTLSNLTVNGTLGVTGAATVGTTLGVSGISTLTNTTINGTVTMGGAGIVTGAVLVASTTFNGAYKTGTSVGQSCTITNLSTLSTNVLTFVNGILTAKTVNP